MGSYISSMPNIVNGKQWMTAMENRKALADDIAQTCVRLNTSGKLSKARFHPFRNGRGEENYDHP